MTTATHNYSWLMPDPGGSANTWGNTLNGTTQAIDAQLWSINTQININGVSIRRGPDGDTYGAILFQSNAGAQVRWQLAETSETESGGNAGSNFLLNAFDDTGAYLGNVFEVLRSNQNVTFQQAVTVGGGLNVGGTLGVTGAVNINGGVATSSSVACGTALYPCYASATDWYLTQGGGYRVNAWSTQWADRWNSANGTRDWTGPSGDLMVLDGSGNFTTTGDITTNSGNLHAKAVSGGNANCWFVRNDGVNMGVVYYDTVNQLMVMQNQIGGGQARIDGVANFQINGNALKPGGGAWLDTSDARIKTVTGSYSAGLDEVAKLNPVKFRYRGNDGDTHALVKGREFIGLVADEAMQAMPEMVSLREGEIDGRKVNDLKTLDPTAIIYALINAVKELKAEIEALKAG